MPLIGKTVTFALPRSKQQLVEHDRDLGVELHR